MMWSRCWLVTITLGFLPSSSSSSRAAVVWHDDNMMTRVEEERNIHVRADKETAAAGDSHRRRHLQNIIIQNPQDRTTAPSPVPPPELKTQRIVVCQAVSSTATETTVSLGYQAETNVRYGGTPTYYIDRNLPAFVAEAAITMAADILCDQVLANDNETGAASTSSVAPTPTPAPAGSRLLRRSLQDLMAHCIISVSSGDAATKTGNCTPTLSESQSCTVYQDSFSVLHNSNCTQEDIWTQSQVLVEQGLTSTEFLQAVNDRLEGTLTVTKLDVWYENQPTVASPVQAFFVNGGGLTSGGKTMIALAVLVAVVMAAVLSVWHRRRQARLRKLHDDMRSCVTNWSSASLAHGSYLQPNPHDLAMRHSNLNVHKCQSAFCQTCRPQLGVVHMLSVPRGSGTMPLRCASPLEQHDTLDLDDDDDDDNDDYSRMVQTRGEFQNDSPRMMDTPDNHHNDDEVDKDDMDLELYPPEPPLEYTSADEIPSTSQSRFTFVRVAHAQKSVAPTKPSKQVIL